MAESREKKCVTVVPVHRKNIHLSINKNHQTQATAKVVPDSRDTSTRRRRSRSIRQNNGQGDEENQMLSDDLHLDEIGGLSTSVNKFKSNTVTPTFMHPVIIEMHEISSIRTPTIIHPQRIRTTTDNFNVTSALSSSKLFSSVMNHDVSSNLSRMKSMEEYQEQKPKRRSLRYAWGVLEDRLKTTAKNTEKNKTDKRNRRCIGKICPACSACCCVSISIGILLLLMGIAALLVFLLTNTHIVTTTATTTTSTTSTSTTSTTSTSTTSTTTTSSTSSTSSTSQTTTTTTSSTSTSTTATTPTPPCIPTSVGSASTLLTISNPTATGYNCYAYTWTSPTTGPVTFMFELRNDPGQWYVDDTSIYQGGTQMLTNIGFETGSLSPWVRTGPYGSCGGYVARICNYNCRSGSYCACDGSNSCADRLSQQFTAAAGQVYIVSFWLRTDSLGAGITATVTLT
ncbi:unnamed protein product [Rotaria socialis]|uniref:Uncharacterized protein n=1 Tax=Rotaria socialis TaxID=392032 RepID=A0A817RWL9_9BILA|nr:unnamed protein product [Rotaria socialis]